MDCQQSQAALLEPVPQLSEMDIWALGIIGDYHGEVLKRRAEDACIQDLKDKGIIR